PYTTPFRSRRLAPALAGMNPALQVLQAGLAGHVPCRAGFMPAVATETLTPERPPRSLFPSQPQVAVQALVDPLQQGLELRFPLLAPALVGVDAGGRAPVVVGGGEAQGAVRAEPGNHRAALGDHAVGLGAF